ncbi:hypothetical protein HFO69_26230 [Rhizobium laguerreae]|uniref:hypothetical protein n=1 Tax=Rhizobium laguerreae TaxID=1076926 RepID=UPI001C9198BE|nr:hypothetical protein [Rhizobium laguerreae]MBY3101168.1 hypothetical protein [Rhizobium laguerreae]
MSILSSTQGTPERVWSLVSLVAANDGRIDRAEAASWLNPTFVENNQLIAEKDSFAQVQGAATALGALTVVNKVLELNPECDTADYLSFADWTHGHLRSLESVEKDAVILEAYAWVLARCQQEGDARWFTTMAAGGLADAINEALPEGSDDDGERRMNTSKLASWRRWLIFLGLMEELPFSGAFRFHLSATKRIAREIASSDLPRDVEMSADDFLFRIRNCGPYLDGGKMFLESARNNRIQPDDRRLSPIVSSALRDLHDAGVIELKILGDRQGYHSLTGDIAHRVAAFHAVTVRGEGQL